MAEVETALEDKTSEMLVPSQPEGAEGTSMRNINRYTTKKTVAQGLYDVALLSANAMQLKFVLQAGWDHPFYVATLTLISLSIFLQVVVAIFLVYVGLKDAQKEGDYRRANQVNNAIVILIFIISIINIFISTFGMDYAPSVKEKLD